MLAAEHRLRAGDAFRRTVRSGTRASSSSLVVHVRFGAEPVPARVGFVVGRGIGGAVVRNRVRRRLRHLVRDHLDRLPAGSELVVRALPRSAEMSTAELGVELTRCLDRALVETGPQKAGPMKAHT